MLKYLFKIGDACSCVLNICLQLLRGMTTCKIFVGNYNFYIYTVKLSSQNGSLLI